MTRGPSAFEGFSIPLDWGGGWPAPGQGVSVAETATRLGEELRTVLCPGSDIPSGFAAYRMYRGVCLDGDRQWFEDTGIRYDITVLAPRWPCPEPVKTLGHTHSTVGPSGLTYPELYQVVAGTGLFLLQGECSAVLVQALAGEVVWVPPGFGHVTLNPGPAPLVMANLIATACEPCYAPFTDRGGAAWHLIAGGDRLVPVPNPLYPRRLPLAQLQASQWNDIASPGLEVGPVSTCAYRWAHGNHDRISVLTCPGSWWDPRHLASI